MLTEVTVALLPMPASTNTGVAYFPTLAEAGLDVDFVNWRALFAPPGLSEAQVGAVTSFVTKVHDSPQWKTVLERQGWTDDFRTGPEAAAFIADQQTKTAAILQELGL